MTRLGEQAGIYGACLLVRNRLLAMGSHPHLPMGSHASMGSN
jgi:hypothetical protein